MGGPASWAWAFWRGKNSRLSEAVRRLRKVLTLERSRRFADTAVIGGLDAYLRNFLAESVLPPEHRLKQLLRSLPPGGYGELHPVQRQRVIEELEKALSDPLPHEPPSRVEPGESKPAAALRPARPNLTPAPPADIPLEALKGVSRAYAGKLKKLGVEKAGDLLWLFPFRYHDFSEVRPVSKLVVGEEQTVLGEVFSAGAGLVGRRRATEALVQDSAGGMLRVVWWGQTYLARQLKTGMKVALSGKVTAFRGRLQMENPEWEPLEGESLHTRRLVPVYPGTEGLPQRLVRRLVREGFELSLPFGLTAAQRRAIDEVLRDIGGSVPMSRLLEGDVGSGKTVVAATALLAAVAGGYQGAIMAPTEVLAEQHYRTFCGFFSGGEEALWRDVFQPEYLEKPLRVTLLRGSLKASEKAAAQDSLARGETDIAIGTQALIQGEVSFQRLGLVVVDEQHRFGVEQRAALRQKGASPHVLVM